MKMNARLKAYLRSLGLSKDAGDEDAWDFFRSLRGLQATVANVLNYDEQDQQARASCDVALRAMGVNPLDPTEQLDPGQRRQPEPAPAGDGASADGGLERAAEERGRAAERARCEAIRQLCDLSGTGDELRTQLLDGDVGIEEARRQIWEDHQQRSRADVQSDIPAGAPAGHSRDSVTGHDVASLSAGFMLARGLDPTANWYDLQQNCSHQRRISDAEHRAVEMGYQIRRCSLEDFIRMCARLDGVTLPPGPDAIFQSYFSRGTSTAALSAVFTTSVNSELMGAYDVAPDSTTGGWVRENDVRDFRQNERARMVNGGALKKLPRGAEADHATYEDAVETFKIARYASQFVIDEQDVIDDNFGGISGFVPADMGTAARQLRPDLIYTILLGNPDMRDAVALFHANHGNLSTSSALNGTNLAAVRKKMRILQENGRNLDLAVKYLIVPPALEDTADTLVTSRALITGENSTQPEKNPNYGKGIIPVTDARLENGVTDPTDGTGGTVNAGSASTWFVAAEKASIECAYRRGTGRRPAIRPFVLTQGQWGLGWDVNLDIGAKALDWLTIGKATG